jgi:signal transduction histidine kinase
LFKRLIFGLLALLALMSLSAKYIDRKGQIWAEKHSGGGATFHFTLPLAA